MADISKIKLPNGNEYDLKDATARAQGKVSGVKGDAENSYRTGDVNLTSANIGAIAASSVGNTELLVRPKYMIGSGDVTLDGKINCVRANRLAFLPANQIIIEKTTDGGNTWVDAGISDAVKRQLFSEVRQASVTIPLLNGVRSLLCGLRVTFTAMKYNVPPDTPETQKYDYWNSNYLVTTERYNLLKEMHFYITAYSDSIGVKLERATGGASNTWDTAFSQDGWGMEGYSGDDYISFSQSHFGGNASQINQYWNYRLTFMTLGVHGTNTLSTASNKTYAQIISEIRGYGNTFWIKGTEYAATDKIYTHDYQKNVTFPAKVTATQFDGDLTGSAAKVNNHTVETDVPEDAVFTDTKALESMTGTLPIAHGGTGATTALAATQNLGVFSYKAGNDGSILIPANADLNDYITPGAYHSNESSKSITLTNTPITTSGFRLFVQGSYATNYLWQFVIGADGLTNKIYCRRRNASSGWSNWGCIYSTTNKPTKSDVGLDKVNNVYSTGIIAVKGTQTESTGVWTGNINVAALYDGLTIAYYLPYAVPSSTNVSLKLTLSDGTTTPEVPVYTTNATRATTHYGAGSTVILTYWGAGSISVAGTATTGARWTRADYNSNTDTKVRQSLASGNANRPLLMAYSDNTATAANVDNVAYRNNNIYANPYTGKITATGFAGNLEGTVNGYSIAKSVPSNAVFTDTTYSVATTTSNGLMSAADKASIIKMSDVYIAILNCFAHVNWADNQGPNDYDTLHNLINPGYITAVYTQSGTVYTNSSLDSLKSNLVVTYYEQSSSPGTVLGNSDYTLSGILTEGTSTIKVTYRGSTATFNVTVTEGDALFASLSLGNHSVYPTDALNSLKAYLTVTARINGETSVVDNYTLSGNIGTVGDQIVTVTYGTLTDTITVPVSTNTTGILYEWDFTKSLTDFRQTVTAVLGTGEAVDIPGKSEGTTPPVRNSTGIVFSDAQQFARLLGTDIVTSDLLKNKTVEVDVASFDLQYTLNVPYGMRFLMLSSPDTNGYRVFNCGLAYMRGISTDYELGWKPVYGSPDGTLYYPSQSIDTDITIINGHTVGVYFNTDGTIKMYIDGVSKGTSTGSTFALVKDFRSVLVADRNMVDASTMH